MTRIFILFLVFLLVGIILKIHKFSGNASIIDTKTYEKIAFLGNQHQNVKNFNIFFFKINRSHFL